ncbi:amidohydrolase family protein [Brevibacillus dissolubilis]|uniref:amidohydrolase family protein n=1 Tax=Brevibacillus dissolubilis TaxID=1844116 RepID=UPI0011166363|nr:amidohydrolase family protein [Brevibacillus dissolubilis]
MIIDAHAHISNTDYGNLTLYLQQLKEAGIDQGVVVPGAMLDVRKMTDYITGRAKPENPVPDNDYIQTSFGEQEALHGFVCINPHQADAMEILEKAAQAGFRGLKLSPMSHEFSFASKIVNALAERCGELGFPMYTHVLYNPGASTPKFVQLAKNHPKTNFIIGHMGFGPADQEAVEAAVSLENFYLESSLGNYLHFEEVVKRAGATKLIFGSEFPLSHPAIEVQKIHMLHVTDGEKEQILGGNIKNLLHLP